MSTVDNLDETVAARWRDELRGTAPVQRRHWRTKTTYYEAVQRLLAEKPGRILRWETVVDAVRPKGSRSTFYDVTGANATHPLIGRYQAAVPDIDCAQIAFSYRCMSAVDQLIHETKVWSYWNHRDTWLARWRDQRSAEAADSALAESLRVTVRDWARDHPTLAAAVDFAPPACAVEDLTLICRGGLLALRAFEILTEITAGAVRAVVPPQAPVQLSPARLGDGLPIMIGAAP